MAAARLSVVIPAFNEAASIPPLVAEIRKTDPHAEVIVVDDGSSDGTGPKALAAGARVITHPYNMGNGAAVKSGIRAARGDVIVFLDGDGQHDPALIPQLLDRMDTFDMVVAARTRSGQASLARAAANRLYNWMASYVARFAVADLTSGFRAVRADAARRFLYLLPNGFSYPTTLTLALLRSGRSVAYVPAAIRRRSGGDSKIRLFGDGTRFFIIITKICILYSPLRVFLPVSGLLFLLGLSYYLFTFVNYGRFTNMSALLFSTSIIIFMMGLISEQICQMRYDRSEMDPASMPSGSGTGGENANTPEKG